MMSMGGSTSFRLGLQGKEARLEGIDFWVGLWLESRRKGFGRGGEDKVWGFLGRLAGWGEDSTCDDPVLEK
jgi:hypothetical protein